MANYQDYADFFAGVRMTTLAEAALVRPGIPRVLPDWAYTPGPTRPFDDKVQWPSVTYDRNGVRIVARNSPPPLINLGNTQWNYATLFNMAEEWSVPIDFMTQLFNTYEPVRVQAQMELRRRMVDFNTRVAITRTNVVQSLFANGKVWISASGNVQADASGAYITFDPGVPTGNVLSAAGGGGGYATGDWSNPATDIQGFLRGIQEYNVRQNNYSLNTIIYGTSVPTYLSQNTGLEPYFVRDPSFRGSLVASNTIPQGFLDFNWIPARLAYLINSSNTPVATFPSNFLGIMPGADTGFYEFVEGGTQIPTNMMGAMTVAPSSSIESLINMFTTAYGKYSYGILKSTAPVGVAMVQGDVSGGIFKVPSTYYYGAVT